MTREGLLERVKAELDLTFIGEALTEKATVDDGYAVFERTASTINDVIDELEQEAAMGEQDEAGKAPEPVNEAAAVDDTSEKAPAPEEAAGEEHQSE